MDEGHLGAAARYVALNPVRARLVDRAGDWPWSSARAHLAGVDDGLVEVAPLLERLGEFGTFLGGEEDQQATRALRISETTGRPVGTPEWVSAIELETGDHSRRESAGRSRRPRRKFRVFSKLSP